MKLTKIKIAFANSLWQTFPMLATLVISLLVVKWFTLPVWGNIVTVLVIQQIANGIIAWGNKDYLQRELGTNPNGFATAFSQLFLERFLLFVPIVLLIFISGFVDKSLFVSFVLIVFLRFVNQSFDILIITQRRFLLTLLLDLLVLLFQVGALFFLNELEIISIRDLLAVFWLPLLLKCLLLFFIFRKNFQKVSFKKLLLANSFFFGMLTISGSIHSKIDVLIVSKLLDFETLGKYQIIMSFLWCIQSISMFVCGPFVHNFYRLNQKAQTNSSRLLKNIGLIVVPISVACVMLAVHYMFDIKINFSIAIASLVFGIASFIYLPWIFQINQRKAEHRVLIINIAGTCILIALLFGIQTVFGLTLENTLWTVAFHQVLITVIVFLANKKRVYV